MDPEMLELTELRIKNLEFRNNCKLVNGNFKEIDTIAKENDWFPVSGILFDLGSQICI